MVAAVPWSVGGAPAAGMRDLEPVVYDAAIDIFDQARKVGTCG
jgi:hypothetical protein